MSLADIQKPNSQTLYGFWSPQLPITAASNNILSTNTDNIFIGTAAGNKSLSGGANIGIGSNSGTSLSTGQYNCFMGVNSGKSLTVGSSNVSIGYRSSEIMQGSSNVSVGNYAGFGINGSNNVAYGAATLQSANLSCNGCVAVGGFAASTVKDASNIVAIGDYALNGVSNNAIVGDIAIGYKSLYNYKGNSISPNIAIGYQSGLNYTGTEGNNIVIGSTGITGDVNTIRLGTNAQTKFIVPAAYQVVGGTTSQLFVDSNGRIGITASLAKYKKNIKPLSNTEKIHDLVPIEYDFKTDDSESVHQFGLLAEHTKKVMPEICHIDNGELRGVRYHELIPYLLKEIQNIKKEIDTLNGEVVEDSHAEEEMYDIYNKIHDQINKEKQLEEEKIKYDSYSPEEKAKIDTQIYKDQVKSRYPPGSLSDKDLAVL